MTRRTRVRPLLRGLVVVTLLLPTACGDGGPTLVPVTGQVLFNGQPAEGATVVLHPAGESGLLPSGTTGPDGTFTLRTHPHGEGAPPGDYAVVVTWFPPGSRNVEKPKNQLPDRYAHAGKSGLEATVRTEATQLEPFNLTR